LTSQKDIKLDRLLLFHAFVPRILIQEVEKYFCLKVCST
jgi:hypothetical protein